MRGSSCTKNMNGNSTRDVVWGGKLEKEDPESECEKSRSMYEFTRADVTNYHKLSGLKHQKFVLS